MQSYNVNLATNFNHCIEMRLRSSSSSWHQTDASCRLIPNRTVRDRTHSNCERTKPFAFWKYALIYTILHRSLGISNTFNWNHLTGKFALWIFNVHFFLLLLLRWYGFHAFQREKRQEKSKENAFKQFFCVFFFWRKIIQCSWDFIFFAPVETFPVDEDFKVKLTSKQFILRLVIFWPRKCNIVNIHLFVRSSLQTTCQFSAFFFCIRNS